MGKVGTGTEYIPLPCTKCSSLVVVCSSIPTMCLFSSINISSLILRQYINGQSIKSSNPPTPQ
ncbi:hypothetical protein Hdeb2414_s0252g00848211 [Helianthus debilis subsp. tardiflorus]